MKKNILITGKNSRFLKFFKKDKYKNDFNFYLPNRKTFDITKYSSMMNYLKKKKNSLYPPYSWFIDTDDHT